jgi:thioredoxin 1
MSMNSIVTLTNDNFHQEVTESKSPVLVDFWASWCAPCRSIAPHLEALAEQYQGRCKIAKLNVDDHPDTAGALGIRSLPTLLFFKDGEVKDQLIGAVPKDRIEELIKSYL